MEDDKKKRKNKKKKNKQHQQQQAKAASDRSSNAGETSSQDCSIFEERNDPNQASGTANGGLDDGSNTIIEDTGGSSHSNGGTLVSSIADKEKHKWLQEEVRLREMIRQLLYEKTSYVQSQADLESSMKQLLLEIESWHQKEVSLEERIGQLAQEKADVTLEEARLKEKIRHIEKEKFLLVETENSSKELTATLNNENTRLRMQVLGLEGAQNSLSQENMQLLDNILVLESRIRDLESSVPTTISPAVGPKDVPAQEDLNAQIEAAFALIEKLVAENAELVEKLNELYMELEKRQVVPGVTSIEVSDYSTVPDPISESVEDFSMSSSSAKQFETVLIADDRLVSDDFDSDYYANVVRQSSETAVSGEIVQLPLSENEVQDLELQTYPAESNDSEGVPITDAPLIGAPFRLISFVAKYVSGADLVNKISSDSLAEH